MTKVELRKKYKKLRLNQSLSQIDDYSLKICNQLLKLPIWNADYYHIFLPITSQNEVNTEYVLNILSGKDKHILISKSNFNTREMLSYLLTDATVIRKNEWNIPEPVDGIEIASDKIDVVFVPLLAFDKQGHRVGYGKGFYDKFLAKCRKDIITVGLSFFEAEVLIEDVIESDISLNFCVTPNTIYRF